MTPAKFKEKYPLTMQEALGNLMVFRENIPIFSGMPYPSMNGIRKFAEYAGYSYGTIRTALSRARAAGTIESFKDDQGITRFKQGTLYRSISNTVISWKNRPEGYLLAVFSFKTEQEKERQTVRQILTDFYFKKIAQNVYINGRIETNGLMQEFRSEGLDKNIMLFHCENTKDEALRERILEVFDIKARSAKLMEFRSDFLEFLNAPGENEA